MNQAKFTSVDQYIETFPEETQKILQKIRKTMHALLPNATEAISYGIPAFNIDSKYIVYFSGWKEHVSIYPRPSGDEALDHAVEPYVSGKGTLKFELDQPIPYDLIERVTRNLLERRNEKS